MAMFTAYFDASGNAVDQPNVVVSGYIANLFQWQLIDRSWRNYHKLIGVDLPFHAADLMAAMSKPSYQHQKNARKDYVLLATDPVKAEQFVNDLAALQLTMVNCAVTAIVPMDIYNGVSSLLDLREIVPPYALAARMCIKLVHQWEKNFGVEEPVECIFEEGDLEQPKFTELMVAEGYSPPIYKKKVDFVGLQAADHYAWERAVFAKFQQSENFKPRMLFNALVFGIPKLHIQATTETLINVCHMKKIDPRTGVKHEQR